MSIRSGEPLITVLHFCASCLIFLLPSFPVSGSLFRADSHDFNTLRGPDAAQAYGRDFLVHLVPGFLVSDFLVGYFIYRRRIFRLVRRSFP